MVLGVLGKQTALALLLLSGAEAWAQAPRPLTIVAIGASNTSGWGVGTEKAYPARLETLLRNRGYDARVTNAGIPFNTTAGMLRRIDSDVPAGTDIVILQPGGNDRQFLRTAASRAANISAMRRRLEARRIKVIMFDPPLTWAYYQWDSIHFNNAAHAWIAKTLLPLVMAAAARSHQPSNRGAMAPHRKTGAPPSAAAPGRSRRVGLH